MEIISTEVESFVGDLNQNLQGSNGYLMGVTLLYGDKLNHSFLMHEFPDDDILLQIAGHRETAIAYLSGYKTTPDTFLKSEVGLSISEEPSKLSDLFTALRTCNGYLINLSIKTGSTITPYLFINNFPKADILKAISKIKYMAVEVLERK